MNNHFDKHYVTKRFWIRCICLFGVFVSGVVFCWVLLEPFWLNIVKDKIIFDVNELNDDEIVYLNSLINANKLHTAEFAFDKIISFYENLITTIIAISAVFGVIGYLYIKNSHKRDIEDGIYIFCNSKYGENLLKRHAEENSKIFFSRLFNESLNDGELKTLVIKNAQNSDDITKIADDINKILARLSIVEDKTDKINTFQNEIIEFNEDGNLSSSLPKSLDNFIPDSMEDSAIEIDTKNFDRKKTDL